MLALAFSGTVYALQSFFSVDLSYSSSNTLSTKFSLNSQRRYWWISVWVTGLNIDDLWAKSDKVPNPVAVRYAWRNWGEGTLYDANLLPASSFRTDTWKEATRAKK